MTLAELNHLPAPDAERALHGCCASRKWASAMAASRPFADRGALLAAAAAKAATLVEGDWLEAFLGHPRIGDLDGFRKKYATGNEAKEQGGVLLATESVLQKLKSLNDAYFARHGFIFIIFASGRSAAEMLAALEQRLGNTRDAELRNAAGEQRLITQNRLENLVK